MKIKTEKSCKRKKCPYYDSLTTTCESCEWNPKSIWKIRNSKWN